MKVFLRLLCIVLVSTLFWVPASMGSQRGASGEIAVKPIFDAGGLAAGKSVEVHVLVSIEAPVVQEVKRMPPVAVSLVIDRSSSMLADKKIEYALKAAKFLVNALRPEDLFALTAYDSSVEVLYPLSEPKDKQKILGIIDRISPKSTTFLSGGLEEGIKQLEKTRGEFPSRVVLLSDGQANRGITTPEGVAEIGANSRKRGVNVSTIGLGLSFNEDLMQLLAQRGGGQYYYIEDSEDLPAVFKQELDLVVRAFTKNLHASYVAGDIVEDVSIYGYTTAKKGQLVEIDMGDLSSGEKRQVLMKLKLKAPNEAGTQPIGELNLKYADPESGEARNIAVSISITVASDEAAQNELDKRHEEAIRRVKDEVLLLEAEKSRMQAVSELQKGNVTEARNILQKQQKEMEGAVGRNIEVKNKVEQLRIEEDSLESRMASPRAMMAYSKDSKAAAYKSAQGKKQETMLQMGDSGYQVERLQRALQRAGYWDKNPDGVFDVALEKAVKAYQSAKNLPADGIVGPATRNALNI